MFDEALRKRAEHVLNRLREKKQTLVTAESCTGGLIAALLTDIPGASDVFDRGFVTYSNAAKSGLLGVLDALIRRHGAVSAAVARAMAAGALAQSRATIALSVTGIAGPDGGSAEKPVGLVFFGLAVRGKGVYAQENRYGEASRGQVRLSATNTALDLVEKAVDYTR